MTQLTFYIISFCLPLFTSLHEEHYSVTNIDFNRNTDSIIIALKINIDDLDFAIAHSNNSSEINSCKNINPDIDNQIIQYLNSTFSFQINDEPKSKLKYIRKDIAGIDIWLYFSTPAKTDIKEINIMHALLFDVFFNQVNLVIFSDNNKQSGYKTTFYERKFKIILNNIQ
jgi:hypothetical protein